MKHRYLLERIVLQKVGMSTRHNLVGALWRDEGAQTAVEMKLYSCGNKKMATEIKWMAVEVVTEIVG